jgi:hypothetical protein
MCIYLVITCSQFSSRYGDSAKGSTITGSNTGKDNGFFFSPRLPERLWGGGGSASYPMNNRDTFAEVNRPGCEVDHPTPPTAEIRYQWSYTSTPPICLYGGERNFTLELTVLTEVAMHIISARLQKATSNGSYPLRNTQQIRRVR